MSLGTIIFMAYSDIAQMELGTGPGLRRMAYCILCQTLHTATYVGN